MVFVRENPNLEWMMTGGTPISGNLHIGERDRDARDPKKEAGTSPADEERELVPTLVGQRLLVSFIALFASLRYFWAARSYRAGWLGHVAPHRQKGAYAPSKMAGFRRNLLVRS